LSLFSQYNIFGLFSFHIQFFKLRRFYTLFTPFQNQYLRYTLWPRFYVPYFLWCLWFLWVTCDAHSVIFLTSCWYIKPILERLKAIKLLFYICRVLQASIFNFKTPLILPLLFPFYFLWSFLGFVNFSCCLLHLKLRMSILCRSSLLFFISLPLLQTNFFNLTLEPRELQPNEHSTTRAGLNGLTLSVGN